MIVRPLWAAALRYPMLLGGSICLLLGVLAAQLAQTAVIAWAMSAIVQRAPVLSAFVAICAIALVRLLLSLWQGWVAAALGGRVRESVRQRGLVAAMTRERLHDSTARDGEVRAALSEGVDGVDSYVSKYIPALAQVALGCPLVVLLIGALSPMAAMLTAIAVVLAVFGPMLWQRLMARRADEHWDSYEALSADLLESLRWMGTIRLLGDVDATRSRLAVRSEALRRATERVMRSSLAETAVIDFAIQAGTVAAASVALWAALTGHAPAFEVYLILLLAAEAFRPVRDLSRHWHAGYLGLSAVPGLLETGAFAKTGEIVAGEVVQAQEAPRSKAAGCLGPESRLRIDQLGYRYPGAVADVLRAVSLTAPVGVVTAVAGPSGAGKSTLFDLILGLLSPDRGTIDLDGQPVRLADIAVVSQNPVFFAGTIRENLDPGGVGAEDSELVAACVEAGIAEEINALPEGLDTVLAEAGLSLSGGQRQRLALARALLARRPILLVDEPTSALDDQNAAGVVNTLHRVAAGHIVIMISHRTAALSGVDRLYRLAEGTMTRCPR